MTYVRIYFGYFEIPLLLQEALQPSYVFAVDGFEQDQKKKKKTAFGA
jgi:hypothetical protein